MTGSEIQTFIQRVLLLLRSKGESVCVSECVCACVRGRVKQENIALVSSRSIMCTYSIVSSFTVTAKQQQTLTGSVD